MLRSFRSIGAHPPSLTICLVFATNSLLSGNWLVRIPEIQSRLALSEAELGLCLLGMPAGGVLMMPLMGWITARWGAGRVTLLAALGYCVVSLLPAMAWSMPALLAALFGVGVASGAMDIAMNAEAAAIEEERGVSILSTCHGFWSLGAMIGGATGGVVAAWGASLVPHVAVVAVLMVVLLLARRATLLVGRAGSATSAPVFALPTGPLVGLAVIAFCALVGEGAMADWSAVYLKNILGAGAAVAGFGYAFFSAAMAVGRLYGDQIAERFATASIIRAGALLAAAGFGMALLVGHPYAALVGFACVGLGYACMVPLLYRTAARMPGMVSGTSIAAVATAGYAGLFAGPPLIGFTAEVVGLSGALGIVAVLSALAGLLAPGALRRESKETRADASPA